MKKRTLISIILCISITFYSLFFVNVRQVHAWPVSISAGNFVVETGHWYTKILEVALNKIQDIVKYIGDVIANNIIVAYKIAALLAVQKAVALLIGEGDSGGLIIRDYNKYLYISPQQRAMEQMNTFFNTVSMGRLSSFNYEGIGPNYDSYLVAQARAAISGQAFTTNIQNYASDPRQLFSGGNMKGVMAYMQCANNVACYTMTATKKYETELSKAQEIAKSEQQAGFLPQKNATTGRITKPAALAQSALLQIDQLGTQLIMNASGKTDAEKSAAITQIAAGSVISIASRAINYGISDKEGQEIIRTKNNEFPFSIGYSTNGISISSGGVKINTGIAAINGSTMFGNTCATGFFEIDPRGASVNIQGVKGNCRTSAGGQIITPRITGTAPTVNVNP